MATDKKAMAFDVDVGTGHQRGNPTDERMRQHLEQEAREVRLHDRTRRERVLTIPLLSAARRAQAQPRRGREEERTHPRRAQREGLSYVVQVLLSSVELTSLLCTYCRRTARSSMLRKWQRRSRTKGTTPRCARASTTQPASEGAEQVCQHLNTRLA